MVALPVTRAGFVALAGRPNVGKSTLVNGMVGAQGGDRLGQAADDATGDPRRVQHARTRSSCSSTCPGVQRPRDALTERMQHRVESEMAESDAALFVINGEEGVGPGDRFIAGALRGAGVPVVIAVNKVDRLDRAHTLQALTDAGGARHRRRDLPRQRAHRPRRGGAARAPRRAHARGPVPLPGRRRAPTSRATCCMAELVREQVLRRTFQEVPHAVEVVIDDVEDREDGLTLVRALVWVETESQKGILIGAGGRMIKAVGTAARRELERELGTRVHLDLSVRVRRGWRGDDALLDRLGIE